MLFADLVAASDMISSSRSRNRKVEVLAELLGRLDPDEVPVAVAHLAGEPVQQRLDVGWSLLGRIEVQPAPAPALDVTAVHETLDRVAVAAGPGSRAVKEAELRALMSAATAPEQSFLRGLIMRELRQGALEGVMVQAIARAADTDESAVRRALMVSGDLTAVAVTSLSDGPAGLDRFRLQVGRPLVPMLASTAAGVDVAIGELGEVAIDAKLDGARVQVHRDGAHVHVFTRNLNDVTAQVPEIVAAVRDLEVASLVLDGEVIALRDDGRPHPFQTTMSRFSRQTAGGGSPLAVRFFDVLHADGRDTIDLPLRRRLEILDEVVPDGIRVRRLITDDPTRAADFLRETLEAGHEGVMVKDLDSVYEAGRRGSGWRKVKPAHTLDLVVLAVEWGSGRRRGWLSNLHLGALDAESGEFVMLGKTFKGLTDELLAWQTERLLDLETHRSGNVVHVRPELVVEIALDGVQTSSRYPAGMALRFARVKRYREDKTAQEADSVDTVRAIHEGRLTAQG